MAGLLDGEPSDWVFVDNATSAANIVAASLPLQPGDEVLTTDQVYGAVRNALRHYTARAGARLVEAKVPIPVHSENDIVGALTDSLTDRTRAMFIDHVASRSAVVFPVGRIAELCRNRGIPVFVDGAHAPGMLDIDVAALGVDYFVGIGHKWLGAPHGCGLFWCRADRQATLHPLVISHGYGLGFTAEFDWVGTRDPSAWLSVGAAIDCHRMHGGARLRRCSHELAVSAAQDLAATYETESSAPPEMIGSMAAVRLPTKRPAQFGEARRLQVELSARFGVEASIVPIDERCWLRVSASVYNELSDFQTAGRAAAALVTGLDDG